MDIIIKQRDSIASIMLFLFNSFLLPRGIHTLGLEKIFKLLEPFEKSQTAERVGLSRAVKSNILRNYRKGKDVYYEITEQGLKAVAEWRRLIEVTALKYKSSQDEWDNNWEVVNMTLPPDLSEKREEINKWLREYGFGLLNKGVWISPHRFSRIILKYAEELQVQGYIAVLEGKLMRRPEKFLDNIWNLEQLDKEYKEFNNKYNDIDKKEHITNKQALVFLLNLGGDYISIAGRDPMLPASLLNRDWEGFKAFLLFNRLRSKLLSLSVEYANEIIEA